MWLQLAIDMVEGPAVGLGGGRIVCTWRTTIDSRNVHSIASNPSRMSHIKCTSKDIWTQHFSYLEFCHCSDLDICHHLHGSSNAR